MAEFFSANNFLLFNNRTQIVYLYIRIRYKYLYRYIRIRYKKFILEKKNPFKKINIIIRIL